MSDALVELDLLEKSELRHRWQKAFGSAAPPRLSRDMMMLALGWRAQAKVDGGSIGRHVNVLHGSLPI